MKKKKKKNLKKIFLEKEREHEKKFSKPSLTLHKPLKSQNPKISKKKKKGAYIQNLNQQQRRGDAK